MHQVIGATTGRLTAKQKAGPLSKITTTGMQGYSEAGQPEGWDMAVGTVRGYRWWKLAVPESWCGVLRPSGEPGHYDVNGKPVLPVITPEEFAEMGQLPRLTGAYGCSWADGRNEATCRKRTGLYTDRYSAPHEPPEYRESCGCGFWAYWDATLKAETVLPGWSDPRSDRKINIAVFGAVEGSGRVIIGEKGFRSQYAKITALAIGAVSMPYLVWWAKPAGGGGEFSHEDQYGARKTYRALGGGGPKPDMVEASPDEVLARVARIEDALTRAYPSARILTSEQNLAAIYPPDNFYGKQV